MRRESFHTSGPLALDLELPSGEIEVEAVAGDETVVELSTSSGREDAQRAIDEARVELRPRGDGNVVVVEVRRQGRFGGLIGGTDITLRVTCPAGADVEVKTASADVSLRGRLGGLRAEIASGDLRADEHHGRVDVKSASGDVSLGVAGDAASVSTASGDIDVRSVHGEATFRSASGDIQVGEAADSISLQTASGDLRVGSVASGRVVLQSASGDQQIGVRRGSRVHLDVRTMSGDASSELEVRDAPPPSDAPMVELRATSMSGDIHITRA